MGRAQRPVGRLRYRAAVTEQLAAWGLEDLSFTAELVASELVTNAIRHATGPVNSACSATAP